MIRLIVTIIGLAVAANSAFAAQKCNSAIEASTPTTDFIINADGTVVHKTTGLMWKTCIEGYNYAAGKCEEIASGKKSFNWADALKQVNTLNSADGFAGKQDWRLPNIKELASIVEVSCNSSAFNQDVFPSVNYGQGLWSVSPNFNENNQVYSVSGLLGLVGLASKGAEYRIRLVRTIQ